jgi:hypothetical protein
MDLSFVIPTWRRGPSARAWYIGAYITRATRTARVGEAVRTISDAVEGVIAGRAVTNGSSSGPSTQPEQPESDEEDDIASG